MMMILVVVANVIEVACTDAVARNVAIVMLRVHAGSVGVMVVPASEGVVRQT